MWGSVTVLYLQLFQQVLLLLSLDLQVAVMGNWGVGGVGEAGSHVLQAWQHLSGLLAGKGQNHLHPFNPAKDAEAGLGEGPQNRGTRASPSLLTPPLSPYKTQPLRLAPPLPANWAMKRQSPQAAEVRRQAGGAGVAERRGPDHLTCFCSL